MPAAPLDYTAIAQQLIFQPMESSLMTVTVFTASDTIIEGPEQFSAQISNPSPSDQVTLQDTVATINILEIDRKILNPPIPLSVWMHVQCRPSLVIFV